MGRKKKKKLIPGTREWWADTKRLVDEGYEHFWSRRPGERPGYSAKVFEPKEKHGFTDPQASRLNEGGTIRPAPPIPGEEPEQTSRDSPG